MNYFIIVWLINCMGLKPPRSALPCVRPAMACSKPVMDTAVAGGLQVVNDEASMKKAMAWRCKYRLHEGDTILCNLLQMGIHQYNRGAPEIFPNGNDVKLLLTRITGNGFDEQEANHNGIAVQEVPFPEAKSKQLEPLKDYCQRMTKGTCLQECFDPANPARRGDMIYGAQGLIPFVQK